MSLPPAPHSRALLLLLASVTVAFVAILWPFHGAVFWAVVLAIMFTPLQRSLLQRMPGQHNLTAFITLCVCLAVVIFPVVLIAVSVVQEAGTAYEHMRSGKLDWGTYLQQIFAALPAWLLSLLERLNLTSLAELQATLQTRLAAFGTQASRFLATQALNVGQNTLHFMVGAGVMLYLLFFLLRDGMQLAARVRHAIPLQEAYKQQLARKFITVTRATVKGNIAVAAAQGALGGFIFWALDIQGPVMWGVIMAFLSLLPAVGASLIWGPVAIYFFATGAVGHGAILTAYGIGVIGLVDNLLRPLLVGKDTKMPDWVVLISTLGGMSLFGLTGFVIGPVIAALFMATWDLFAPPAE